MAESTEDVGVRGRLHSDMLPGDVLVGSLHKPHESQKRLPKRLAGCEHVLAHSCSRDYPSGLQL